MALNFQSHYYITIVYQFCQVDYVVYFSRLNNLSFRIRVCPFNKGSGWLHGTARWLIKHAPWVAPTMIWLDDRLGYGNHSGPKVFWHA